MENPVIQALMDRRSNRAYTAQPVSKEQLNCILTCAFNAPSAMNLQPWHITVVKDRAWLDEMNLAIRSAVLEQDSTRAFAEGDDFFHHAPLALFISSKEGKSGADIGMLTENVLVAAHALGLGSCVIGMAMFAIRGKDGAKFLADLKLPEGFQPHYAIVLGHPADAPDARPRDESKITYM